MDQPTEAAGELQAAWRALAGSRAAQGWRSIALASGNGSRVLAARRLPDDEEAVLAGFESTGPGGIERLPEGAGFEVQDVGARDGLPCWLALVRRPGASLDLFTRMAADVVGLLGTDVELGGSSPTAFLERIRAWQRFMQRGADGVLDPESELGLHGELAVLERLLEAGVPLEAALAAWTGPLDGLHDFRFDTADSMGSIEVKTTVGGPDFQARIASLEQLDETLAWPLHVAAVRMRTGEDGETLAERIARLRIRAAGCRTQQSLLEMRLLHAGYVEARAACYVRRLAVTAIRLLAVEGTFPRLTHACVPAGVVRARYVIDLPNVDPRTSDLTPVLAAIEVT